MAGVKRRQTSTRPPERLEDCGNPAAKIYVVRMVTGATDISDALNAREISSVEVLPLDAFSTIDQGNPEICAFISLTDRDRLVEQAREFDDDRARIRRSAR